MLHTGIILEFITVLSARECFYNIAHIFNCINTLHAIIHQQHLVFYSNVIKMLSQATWDIALGGDKFMNDASVQHAKNMLWAVFLLS